MVNNLNLELAKTFFQKGLESFNSGDFKSAELKFREALSMAPERVSVLTNLAATLVKNGQMAEAKALARKAVSIDNRAFESWITIGICCHDESDFPAALAAYDKALVFRPDSAEAWTNRGATLCGMKRFNEALDCHRRSLGINPKHAAAWGNQGAVLRELKRLDEAVSCHDKVLEIEPNNAKAWCNRGNDLHDLKRYPEALVSLDRALALNADYPKALFYRGVTLQKLWRHQEARDSLEKAIALRPGHALSWERLGSTLLLLKKFEDALSAFDKAIGLDPRLATAWQSRGNALQSLDRHDEALVAYDKAVEINPGLVDAWAARASIYVSDVDNVERAIDESRRSLNNYLDGIFRPASANPAAPPIIRDLQYFRLKHDIEQARYLKARSYRHPGLDEFLDVAQGLMDSKLRWEKDEIGLQPAEWAAMTPYLQTPLFFPMPDLQSTCLNSQNDWAAIEAAYLASRPEVIHIDNFLSTGALAAFREYSLVSKIWLVEYNNKYLGAFANKGFVSHLHLQLARELREAMPRVFKNHRLSHLWGFKYDSTMGKGINVHADFAQVNLNFWITPDQYNLDPESGGLKVYDVPSPPDWPFYDYNENKNKIYQFLEERQSKCIVVPHRCNRAVLFNSALFHETDSIRFREGYESRRINFTYLFGSQL